MEGDRTVSPSPARLRRAWRAGVRPRSQWLVPGLAAIAVAVVVDGLDPGLEQTIAPVRSALASSTVPDLEVLGGLLQAAIGWALTIAALVAGLGIAASLVMGDLGPVDASERRRLGLESVRVGGVVLVGIGLGALAIGVVHLRPVVAAATRAVDASPGALVTVWRAWLIRCGWTVGTVLVSAGIVELWLGRRRRFAVLHRSVAQARDDQRERGGRRG